MRTHSRATSWAMFSPWLAAFGLAPAVPPQFCGRTWLAGAET